MSVENALIVSSAVISKSAFVQFFEALECRWYSGHKDEAIVVDGYTQVGVCLMDEGYAELFQEKDLKEFEVALGAPPRTFFEVSRTRSDDPNKLYLVVARSMAKVWPVAVLDPQDKLVPYEALG
jgi:hypothetical protein